MDDLEPRPRARTWGGTDDDSAPTADFRLFYLEMAFRTSQPTANTRIPTRVDDRASRDVANLSGRGEVPSCE